MNDTAPHATDQGHDHVRPAPGAEHRPSESGAEHRSSNTGAEHHSSDMGAVRLNPRVYVISGPTAVGKGTIVERLRRVHPEIFVSRSATTRRPRPGEVDGVSYDFITNDDFDDLVASGGLLEWAGVHGDRYGTPRKPVERALAEGRPVILEIDLQGARQVRHSYPQAVEIFLAPPSWTELVHRLRGRGTENADQQSRRLRTARRELDAEDEFDHVVVNKDIRATVREMLDLMRL